MHACDTEYTELLWRTALRLRMKINQLDLLEVIPSRQSSPQWFGPCALERACSRCLRNRQREGREDSPREADDSGENAPQRQKWSARARNHIQCPHRHGKELPLLQTPSNQDPNLKFQLMAVYFFVYKKLGSEMLESEREIFSAHLSRSASITVDIFMPGWLQTIKFSSWRRLENN